MRRQRAMIKSQELVGKLGYFLNCEDTRPLTLSVIHDTLSGRVDSEICIHIHIETTRHVLFTHECLHEEG